MLSGWEVVVVIIKNYGDISDIFYGMDFMRSEVKLIISVIFFYC